MSKRLEKYEDILKVASHLMSLKGYKGTSLQKITNIVGIHKSTFFHYFKNKEELLLAILNVAVDEPIRNIKKIIILDKNLSPLEKLKLVITDHLYFSLKYNDNVNVYHSEVKHLSGKPRKKYIESRKYYAFCFEQIIKEIKKSGDGYFEGLDSKIVTFGILGMCNWVSQWFKKRGPLKTEDISNIFYQMIINKKL